jgi:hypothetical protein
LKEVIPMPGGDGTSYDGTYVDCMPVDGSGNPLPRGRRRGSRRFGRGIGFRSPPETGYGLGRGGLPRGRYRAQESATETNESEGGLEERVKRVEGKLDKLLKGKEK